MPLKNENVTNLLKILSDDLLVPCDETQFKITDENISEDVENFIKNLIQVIDPGKNDPNAMEIGAKVIAKYVNGQYFTATVSKFSPEKMLFTIDWDDGDTEGRLVKHENLAKNVAVAADRLAVGTKVLFPQGRYTAAELDDGTNRLAGMRWHEGVIDKISMVDGEKTYCGHHRADEASAWKFKDYEYRFENQPLDFFRLAPNMFSLMDQQTGKVPTVDYDIFISHCNSNEALVHKIAALFRDMKYKVYVSKPARAANKTSIKQALNAMKTAEVFICCITDEYANNDFTLQELQYAKKTLNRPVIPIIVKADQWNWTASVVGLLIAGQLYIDFGKEDNFDSKFEELKGNVLAKCNNPEGVEDEAAEEGAVLPKMNQSFDHLISHTAPKLFLSYCWNNSYDFKKDNVIGSQFSDPRQVKSKLEELTGMRVWLDIEP